MSEMLEESKKPSLVSPEPKAIPQIQENKVEHATIRLETFLLNRGDVGKLNTVFEDLPQLLHYSAITYGTD